MKVFLENWLALMNIFKSPNLLSTDHNIYIYMLDGCTSLFSLYSIITVSTCCQCILGQMYFPHRAQLETCFKIQHLVHLYIFIWKEGGVQKAIYQQRDIICLPVYLLQTTPRSNVDSTWYSINLPNENLTSVINK